MTFWEQFYNLCQINGTKPNPVAKELGFSSATVTQWKNGSVPSSKSVSKIADYFNVSTDYLLGNESKEVQLSYTARKIAIIFDGLSEDKKNTALDFIYSLYDEKYK